MKKFIALLISAGIMISCVSAFAADSFDRCEYKFNSFETLKDIINTETGNIPIDTSSSIYISNDYKIPCVATANDKNTSLKFSKGENKFSEGTANSYLTLSSGTGRSYGKYTFSIEFKVDNTNNISKTDSIRTSNKTIAALFGRWFAKNTSGAEADYGNAFRLDLKTNCAGQDNGYTLDLSGHEICSDSSASEKSQTGKWADFGKWYTFTVEYDKKTQTIKRGVYYIDENGDKCYITNNYKEKPDLALDIWEAATGPNVLAIQDSVKIVNISNYFDFSIRNVSITHDRFIIGDKKLEKTDNGYKATVNIGNDVKKDSATPTIIVAMYGTDGKLLKATTQNKTISAKTDDKTKYEDLSAEIAFDESATKDNVAKVKAYLWRTVDGDITPYTESWEK